MAEHFRGEDEEILLPKNTLSENSEAPKTPAETITDVISRIEALTAFIFYHEPSLEEASDPIQEGILQEVKKIYPNAPFAREDTKFEHNHIRQGEGHFIALKEYLLQTLTTLKTYQETFIELVNALYLRFEEAKRDPHHWPKLLQEFTHHAINVLYSPVPGCREDSQIEIKKILEHSDFSTLFKYLENMPPIQKEESSEDYAGDEPISPLIINLSFLVRLGYLQAMAKTSQKLMDIIEGKYISPKKGYTSILPEYKGVFITGEYNLMETIMQEHLVSTIEKITDFFSKEIPSLRPLATDNF